MNQRGRSVILRVSSKVVEGPQLLIFCLNPMDKGPTPEPALAENAECEVSYNAKVVGAATESKK